MITGASAGLGAEFARQCAARGEELVLVARRRDRLEALAASLDVRAHIIVADLAPADAPASLVAQIHAEGLQVDTLINNAGFGLLGAFAALDGARQNTMIDLNVRTLTHLCHLVLPAMLERRRGRILNIASTAAFQPGPGFAVYFATKAYVLSFSEALHQEMKGKGVCVCALCPGPTESEFRDVAGYPYQHSGRRAAAALVVAAGLKGLDRNQAVVVPGLVNKATAQAVRILPRAAIRRIVAAIKTP